MNLAETFAVLRDSESEMSLAAIPYAAHLQLFAQRTPQGLMLRMAYHPPLIGNPVPPRLHGGTVGGMLEVAGAFAVALALGPMPEGASPYPKPVNITIDYLRAAGARDVFAIATVLRIGRSIANVRAEAWQDSRDAIIASAHMNLLVG